MDTPKFKADFMTEHIDVLQKTNETLNHSILDEIKVSKRKVLVKKMKNLFATINVSKLKTENNENDQKIYLIVQGILDILNEL